MKRILTTSAVAMMMSTPAFADAHGGMFVDKAQNVQILGSELIGSYVYVSETELENGLVYEENMETEWDNVGDINEVVLSRDGEVEAIVIGVGGFLGMGEKDVAVKMDSIRFISDGEDADEYFVVFNASQEQLEAAPEWNAVERVERVRYRDTERAAMAYNADASMFDTMDADRFEMVESKTITREDLIGATVFSTKDENIGEVEDVMMRGDRMIAVLEVGGFLDIGDKHVAVPMDQMRVMREAGDDDLRVYVAATEEQLEELPGIDR